MARTYIDRPGSPRRRKKPYKGRKQVGPPPIIFVLLIVIVLVVVIVIIAKMSSEKKDVNDTPKSESSLLSSENDSSNSSEDIISSEPKATSQATSDTSTERDITGLSVTELNTMMIVGDRGYRYYTFSEDHSKTYIDSVAEGADKLSGISQVYNMIIPTATDIMLPQSFLADKNTSDQAKAIDYLNTSISLMSSNVKNLEMYEVLKAHCGEDIFFRTDKNWTSLGAYYAYVDFAAKKGFTPLELTDMKSQEFEGFLGSLYSQSGSESALSESETITAYYPDVSVEIGYGSNQTSPSSLIKDAANFESSKLYNVFLGGDNSYVKIVNESVTDNSVCILVKDSLGNAFVPYLTAHYNKIYMVDYRYWSDGIVDLAETVDANDVILMTNIESTSDESLVYTYSNIF